MKRFLSARYWLQLWKNLPGIWKVILPPVVAFFLFYGIENTRGFVRWQICKNKMLEQGAWFTEEDFRAAHPDAELDFTEVSFVEEWVDTMHDKEFDDGFEFEPSYHLIALSGLGIQEMPGLQNMKVAQDESVPLKDIESIARHYLESTNRFEEVFQEIETFAEAPLCCPKLFQWRSNSEPVLLPDESLDDLESILYYRIQAHIILSQPKNILQDFRRYFVLEEKIRPLNLVDNASGMQGSIIQSAYFYSSNLDGKSNTQRLELLRLLKDFEITPTLSDEEFEVLNCLIVYLLSEIDGHLERGHPFGESLAHGFCDLVDFDMGLPYEDEVAKWIRVALSYLYPSGWLNDSKTDITNLIIDWKSGAKPIPTGINRKFLKNIIFTEDGFEDWIEDVVEQKTDQFALSAFVAAGLAADWYASEFGSAPKSLAELFTKVPAELELGPYCSQAKLELIEENGDTFIRTVDASWKIKN